MPPSTRAERGPPLPLMGDLSGDGYPAPPLSSAIATAQTTKLHGSRMHREGLSTTRPTAPPYRLSPTPIHSPVVCHPIFQHSPPPFLLATAARPWSSGSGRRDRRKSYTPLFPPFSTPVSRGRNCVHSSSRSDAPPSCPLVRLFSLPFPAAVRTARASTSGEPFATTQPSYLRARATRCFLVLAGGARSDRLFEILRPRPPFYRVHEGAPWWPPRLTFTRAPLPCGHAILRIPQLTHSARASARA